MLYVLAGLVFKHFLADFVLQGRYQTENKHIYGHPGGLLHVAIHAAGTFLAFAMASPLFAVQAALIDGALHYHIDWAKMNANRRLGLTPQSRAWWAILGADQMLHYLTYIGLAMWMPQ